MSNQQGEGQVSELERVRPPKRAADPEEKVEVQKRALQKLVLSLLDDGARVGLEAGSVRALKEGLEVLGWLPTGINRP